LWPYSPTAAAKALTKAATEARLRLDSTGQSTIHAHLFRHGLGYRARQAGYDIAQVKDLLGHASIRSTEHYFKATAKETREKLQKLNQNE
jgi:integrase